MTTETANSRLSYLTPRERLLNRAGNVLLAGAIANGVLALLVIVLSIASALQPTNDLFVNGHNLLLGRFSGQSDIALIIVVLLLIVNAGALGLLMVLTTAQELWAPYLIWLWGLLNLGALLLAGFTLAVVSLIFTVWTGVMLLKDWRAFRMNPVMLREVRGRMRGARAFVVLTVYLCLMSAVAVLAYLLNAPLNLGLASSTTGELGRIVFLAVAGIELLLIVFIAPAFTASAITGERERLTYDLLQTTLLPIPTFVTGKLQSALGYIFLLLLAAIPLQSIAFLFGGVGEQEIMVAFVILAATAIMMGAVGLYFSSTTEHTLTASIRAYIVAMILTFGVPLVLMTLLNTYGNALTGVGTGLQSPVLEAFLIYLGLILTSISPIATGLYTQYALIEYRELGFVNITLSSDGTQIPLVSPWISLTVIYLTAAAILLILAVRRTKKADS